MDTHRRNKAMTWASTSRALYTGKTRIAGQTGASKPIGRADFHCVPAAGAAPAVRALADFCDGFCTSLGLFPSDAAELLQRASGSPAASKRSVEGKRAEVMLAYQATTPSKSKRWGKMKREVSATVLVNSAHEHHEACCDPRCQSA